MLVLNKSNGLVTSACPTHAQINVLGSPSCLSSTAFQTCSINGLVKSTVQTRKINPAVRCLRIIATDYRDTLKKEKRLREEVSLKRLRPIGNFVIFRKI